MSDHTQSSVLNATLGAHCQRHSPSVLTLLRTPVPHILNTKEARGSHVKSRISITSPNEHISQPVSSPIKTLPFTYFWGAEGTNLQNHPFLIISQALYTKRPGILFSVTMLIQANIILPVLLCPHTAPGRCSPLRNHVLPTTSQLYSPHSSLSLVEWDILIYRQGYTSVVKTCLACIRPWIQSLAPPNSMWQCKIKSCLSLPGLSR